MIHPQVYILEKEAQTGQWLLDQFSQIDIAARWFPTVSALLAESETHAPVVCLIGVRPPVPRIMSLITDLIQEPRFAHTAFIPFGPLQHKHDAYQAGAHDYLVTPPNVIELRKHVRLHIDRATLEARVVAETSITQEMEALSAQDDQESEHDDGPMDEESITLLAHAAAQTQERNLFEMILATAANAIALVAPDGALLYANPAWQQAYAAQGPTIQPAFGWPPVTDDTEITQTIAQAIADTTTWRGEARFVIDKSRQLDLALTLAPAFDAEGELTGFVIIQTDISERIAAQQQKARFISDAAAELRNPVTNIKMRQYLLREAPPNQYAMHAQALERETDRLSDMVEAILELARLDQGTARMSFEPVDLRRLASEVITRYSPAAREKTITLTLHAPEALPDITVAPAQIARAIGVLIENAINHTPADGRVAVQIDRQTSSGGTYQIIQVSDNGMGIAENEQALIFDRFYRCDRTRSNGIRGVGLGLAIAQKIVAVHRGTITVLSRENEGSTFTLWLPTT